MTNLSSPAPFWKYMEMTTPAKIPSDFSPLKGTLLDMKHEDDDAKLESKEDEDDDDDGAPAVQPSSPPQFTDTKYEDMEMEVDMSPSRGANRHGTKRDGLGHNKLEQLSKPMLSSSLGLGLHSVGGLADAKGKPTGIVSMGGTNTALNDVRPNGMNSIPQRPSFGGLPLTSAIDDEEEGGIDLAK
jgi:hypothetical protein